MRILMLGNSLTTANNMPRMLVSLAGAEVTVHARGGARLAEQLNPRTQLGARTQAALCSECWDYVVLQEMSHGPLTCPEKFFSSVEQLCGQIRRNGAVPLLYATWAYRKGCAKLTAKGWDYAEMARGLSAAYGRAAEQQHTLIAEVGRSFYELADVEPLYAADGVHPSEAGSRIAASLIAAAIQQHKENLL